MVPEPTHQMEEADDGSFQTGAAANVSEFPDATAAASAASAATTRRRPRPQPGLSSTGVDRLDVSRSADAADARQSAEWRRLEEPPSSGTLRLGILRSILT